MDSEVSGKLIRELRGQVNDLSAAVQLLTPLVSERGEKRDVSYLASINKNLYRLIRTVYHLELCENEDHAFFPRLVDVAGLCRDVGREVETAAERLDIDFSWKLDKESVLSMADEELLERAILNQLTNAFQAAGKGGKVSLRCGVANNQFKIYVSDNGKGLKLREGENPLLKSEDGMGLGLAAARRVAALHGGTLMLNSTSDAGVCSVLSLPIRKPEREELIRQERAMGYDHGGDYSTLLVEFSPLLSADSYLPGDVE